jgi:hypothetical protein
MLGPRASRKRTRSDGSTLLARSSRAGRGPAIEDWLAALNSAAGSRSRSHGSNIRRFVHRPRSGLRHHHAARRRCGLHPAVSALSRRVHWCARRLRGNRGN